MKKNINNQTFIEKARREQELEDYGKLVSLRPSKIMRSKKDYKRNKKVNLENENIE